ncbi:tannase [Fusarium napiforme]|uniref:Carboxylic ester hydrolase n=1 Tax=Fusarium napiforme TaxID=42672 RepID=A0A8H5IP62_9HYPO|nr:tannase [Fusarium napiforme]
MFSTSPCGISCAEYLLYCRSRASRISSHPSISQPRTFGLKVLDFAVNLVENYNFEAKSILYYGHPITVAEDVNICNVTVTYTHLGQNDTVHVETWLLMDNFNGRLQSIGRGGWAIKKPLWGSTQVFVLEWLFSRWEKGMMLAQRYPEAWDCINACAPAINWNQFFMWPQLIMQELDYFPHPCEMNAVLAAAIEACDGLDGNSDGIVSNEDACDFDPMDVVGKSFNCPNTANLMSATEEATKTAKSTWPGPTTIDGKFIWYGPNTGAQLSGQSLRLTNDIGLSMTTCSNGTCKGAPVGLGENMSREAFDTYAQEAAQRCESVIETNDPDLTAFYMKGGKILNITEPMISSFQSRAQDTTTIR